MENNFGMSSGISVSSFNVSSKSFISKISSDKINQNNTDVYSIIEELKKNIKKPNILICGYTGAGKTSIIQSLLGNDLVPADKIGAGLPVTQDYEMYENEMIRIWDSKGLEPDKGEDNFINETKNFIYKMQQLPNVDNHIHIYWYVINGAGSKVTPTDLKIIEIFPKESTVIIISKIDTAIRPKNIQEIEDIKNVLINKASISEESIICTSDIEGGRKGIDELFEYSLKILPNAYKKAFEEAQRINLEKKLNLIESKEKEADNIILQAVNKSKTDNILTIYNANIDIVSHLSALYIIDKKYIESIVYSLSYMSLFSLQPKGFFSIFAGDEKFIDSMIFTSGFGNYVKDEIKRLAIAIARGDNIEVVETDNDGIFTNYLNRYKKNIQCNNVDDLVKRISNNENLILLHGDLAKDVYKIKTLKNNLWAILISSLALIIPTLFIPMVNAVVAGILGVGIAAALGVRGINVLILIIKAGSLLFGGGISGAKKVLEILRNKYDIILGKQNSLLIKK
ncbi:GTPase [Brachyspira pulli]|uniref:GTPase n=1 Tax=Brachyspira pulli TaxID=310721 RepID=UPI003005E1D7